MKQRQFSFTLANTSGSTKTVALFAAYLDTLKVNYIADAGEGSPDVSFGRNNPAQIVAAGFDCDAVLDDGTIDTGLVATAASSKFKIRDMARYILLNPTLLRKITLASANTDVYEKTISTVRLNPTGNQGEEYIHLTEFFNVQQYNDGKIVVPVEMELSDEVLMRMPIDTGRTITITLHF
jgi:hypothetical protein